ncbi:MAG TPA: hypothetical protein VGG49_04200 [Steroidobacteraceae bacterium]|jgi:uncharacterized membrane protein YqjE
MIIPGTASFAERTRSLLRQVLAMGQTRLEMLGLAVEQEVSALGRELRLAAICIIAAWLAGTSMVLWVAVMFPRQVGLWILGVLCVLFAFTSLMSWQILKRVSMRERLFTRLAEQLRQDAQALETFAEDDHD